MYALQMIEFIPSEAVTFLCFHRAHQHVAKMSGSHVMRFILPQTVFRLCFYRNSPKCSQYDIQVMRFLLSNSIQDSIETNSIESTRSEDVCYPSDFASIISDIYVCFYRTSPRCYGMCDPRVMMSFLLSEVVLCASTEPFYKFRRRVNFT